MFLRTAWRHYSLSRQHAASPFGQAAGGRSLIGLVAHRNEGGHRSCRPWMLVAASSGACGTACLHERRSSSQCYEDHDSQRMDTPSLQAFVLSQAHLLQPTSANPTPTTVPPPIAALSGHQIGHRWVTSIIGLPLRGQAHMAHRLKCYLSFFHGANVSVFDVNQYVRPGGDQALLDALREFFEASESTAGAAELKEHHVKSGNFVILYTSNAMSAVNSRWSGHSKWRRRWMATALEEQVHARACFVEIQVDGSGEHTFQYIQQHRLATEYKAGELEGRIEAYARRFETIQNDGTEDDMAYIKLVNYNKKVVTNNMMNNFLGSRVARFLGACHPYRHTVYLTAAGETEYNRLRKLGGNSGLSELGREFACRFAEFSDVVVVGQADDFACVTLTADEVGNLKQRLTGVPVSGTWGGVFAKGPWDDVADQAGANTIKPGMRLMRLRGKDFQFEDAPRSVSAVLDAIGSDPATLIFANHDRMPAQVRARLWTSALLSAQQTGAHVRQTPLTQEQGKPWLQMMPRAYRNLDEVYVGEYEGLSYDDVQQRQPKEAQLQTLDKLGYRYPRGESYYDVIARLDDYILQLETVQEPVVVVSHQAVLRLIYAYLAGIPREKAPEIDIPHHTVIKIDSDGAGGMRECRYFLGPTVSER